MTSLLKRFNIFKINLKGVHYVWSSRDVALVIITAVISFVYAVFVGQMGTILTGISGVNYIFTIGMALTVSLTFLLFEGRRWRFFFHNTLFLLITFPTFLTGPPYSLLHRIPTFLCGIQADIILNSFYPRFKRRNQLVLWSIIVGVEFFLINPFLQIILFPLFVSPEIVMVFVDVALLLLPVIIAESVFGGYLAYKVYERVKKIV